MSAQHTPEQPKPCPHCGGEPRWIHHSNNFAGEALMSLHCCASVLGSRAYVLAKWNTRLPVEQQRDEMQKAVTALSHQIALANGAVLLARQQRDAALAGLSRIAKYPLTRADELSAEQMRDLALNYHAKGLGCCQYCGGSGDVHGLDGEWRGECTECDAAAKARGQA
jgi:hypothetical protein